MICLCIYIASCCFLHFFLVDSFPESAMIVVGIFRGHTFLFLNAYTGPQQSIIKEPIMMKHILFWFHYFSSLFHFYFFFLSTPTSSSFGSIIKLGIVRFHDHFYWKNARRQALVPIGDGILSFIFLFLFHRIFYLEKYYLSIFIHWIPWNFYQFLIGHFVILLARN